MALTSILDPVLQPLLSLGPFFTILIICLIISLITTIIYKYATNQEHLKELKADMKRLQKKASAYSKEGKSDKAMKIQKDLMKMNMQVMKSSFKSTIYTFIPILLFFGWLSVNLSFAPIMPDSDFSVTLTPVPDIISNSSVTLIAPDEFNITSSQTKNLSSEPLHWNLKSSIQGEYELIFVHDTTGEEFAIPVLVTSQQEYLGPIYTNTKSAVFKQAQVNNDKLIILQGVPFFEHFPVIKNWGWFGIYFLFAIGFSIGLKKLLKLA